MYLTVPCFEDWLLDRKWIQKSFRDETVAIREMISAAIQVSGLYIVSSPTPPLPILFLFFSSSFFFFSFFLFWGVEGE